MTSVHRLDMTMSVPEEALDHLRRALSLLLQSVAIPDDLPKIGPDPDQTRRIAALTALFDLATLELREVAPIENRELITVLTSGLARCLEECPAKHRRKVLNGMRDTILAHLDAR